MTKHYHKCQWLEEDRSVARCKGGLDCPKQRLKNHVTAVCWKVER